MMFHPASRIWSTSIVLYQFAIRKLKNPHLAKKKKKKKTHSWVLRLHVRTDSSKFTLACCPSSLYTSGEVHGVLSSTVKRPALHTTFNTTARTIITLSETHRKPKLTRLSRRFSSRGPTLVRLIFTSVSFWVAHRPRTSVNSSNSISLPVRWAVGDIVKTTMCHSAQTVEQGGSPANARDVRLHPGALLQTGGRRPTTAPLQQMVSGCHQNTPCMSWVGGRLTTRSGGTKCRTTRSLRSEVKTRLVCPSAGLITIVGGDWSASDARYLIPGADLTQPSQRSGLSHIRILTSVQRFSVLQEAQPIRVCTILWEIFTVMFLLGTPWSARPNVV